MWEEQYHSWVYSNKQLQLSPLILIELHSIRHQEQLPGWLITAFTIIFTTFNLQMLLQIVM